MASHFDFILLQRYIVVYFKLYNVIDSESSLLRMKTASNQFFHLLLILQYLFEVNTLNVYYIFHCSSPQVDFNVHFKEFYK